VSARKMLLGTENQLLAAMAPADRERVLAACTVATLELGKVVYEQGARMRHIYFPIDGFISMLTTVDESSTLEIGMVGREGVCGYTVLLGSDMAPMRALTQGAGVSLRMTTASFRELVARMPSIRDIFHRYMFISIEQLARTSACSRFHVVEQRLARWLLMTHDRARADLFAVTQEFLAYMLGVRRVGVSAAANTLKARGLIDYKRGAVSVLSRSGLEAAACSCYRADINAYEREWLIRHKPTRLVV
jgi:CRP-like cAMP-binding protein